MPLQYGVIVLCDANVLYGSLLRDILVRLGIQGIIRPRWTSRIQEEWIQNLLDARPDLNRKQLERTQELMELALPEGLIQENQLQAVQPLRNSLPDEDDVHVLSAAIACQAQILLTFNLKDFPVQAVPAGIQVIHPDHFLLQIHEQRPTALPDILGQIQQKLRNPPMSQTKMLEALTKAGLPQTAQQLQPSISST